MQQSLQVLDQNGNSHPPDCYNQQDRFEYKHFGSGSSDDTMQEGTQKRKSKTRMKGSESKKQKQIAAHAMPNMYGAVLKALNQADPDVIEKFPGKDDGGSNQEFDIGRVSDFLEGEEKTESKLSENKWCGFEGEAEGQSRVKKHASQPAKE